MTRNNTCFVSRSAQAAMRLLLTLIMALGVSALAAPSAAASGPAPDKSTAKFEIDFMQDMIDHHAMAVMMARPAAANAGHQEVKDLAQAMIDDQTREIAQMRTWAKDWYGLDIPDHVAMMDQMMGSGQTMPGMGQGGPHHSGMPMTQSGGMPMMPGMPMQQSGDMSMMHDMSMMASLWKLPPNRLEVVFLSQMIPHHQHAIDMAMLVPDRAAHQELKDLAKSIAQSQGDETSKMNGWLGSWYSL